MVGTIMSPHTVLLSPPPPPPLPFLPSPSLPLYFPLHLPTPHTHHHHPQGSTRLHNSCGSHVGLVVVAMESHGEHDDSARRRRMRRLRQWQRHERMTVAMALTEATHQAAPRRQKPVSPVREEVERATNYGPRALKTPPPGERPGILAEPGPQRSDRSLRRSAGDSHPTLGLPVLAEVSGDAVDASTSRFLTAAARLARGRELQQLREEDQELKNRPKRRKRKKRRRKRLPKASSSLRLVPRAVRTRQPGSSWCSVSGCCLTCPGLLDFWEMTSTMFPHFTLSLVRFWMRPHALVSVTFGWYSPAPLYLAVACSALFVL